jgi:hypothetical protein
MKILAYSVLTIFIAAAVIFGADYLYEIKVAKPVLEQTNLQVKTQLNSNKQSVQTKSPNLQTSNFKVIEKTPPHFLPGFDWSLPDATEETEYSGLTAWKYHNLEPVKNSFLIVRWDESNPRQGKYDFSQFEKDLKQIAPQKALVRLEVNSACEAPKWALRKMRASDDKSLIFWDKAYLDATKPFIQNFAARFASDPQIIGVQLGLADGEYKGSCDDFGNKDGWGEFWISPQARAVAETEFGLNPDIFESSTKANIEVYVNAFGKYKYKLVFTSLGPLFTYGKGSEPYNLRNASIASYVISKGVGSRDGAIENWMSYSDKIYGNIFTSMSDGTCRLDFDENFAQKIRGRYWGTENEFYGNKDYVLDVHGPYENQPYRFLMSSLRALQMRRNFISVSNDGMKDMDHPLYKTQEFMRYLTKVLGKQIKNTPDAFVLLGERYLSASRTKDHKEEACVKNSGNKIAIRSFGRWLSEDSESSPAIKTSMPKEEKYWGQDYYMPDGIDYEYFARESRIFSFDINDQLTQLRCKDGCELEVKATFKDTSKTTLNTFVAEGRSQPFETRGDNQIKTVTFKIKSDFANKLDGSDIVLKSEQGPIPLILLRLNFL